MSGLFFDQSNYIVIDAVDADIVLYPDFFSQQEADQLLIKLRDQLQWSEEKIMLYGKQHNIPRLSAWYADEGKSYTYSGLYSKGLAWHSPLLELRRQMNEHCACYFNSVLANYYRSETDSVAWHADDEPELGPNPIIASLSFGHERQFMLKHKNKNIKKNILLPHGSLLIMRGPTQHHWLHQIAKSKKPMAARINLTFRQIQS